MYTMYVKLFIYTSLYSNTHKETLFILCLFTAYCLREYHHSKPYYHFTNHPSKYFLGFCYQCTHY